MTLLVTWNNCIKLSLFLMLRYSVTLKIIQGHQKKNDKFIVEKCCFSNLSSIEYFGWVPNFQMLGAQVATALLELVCNAEIKKGYFC